MTTKRNGSGHGGGSTNHVRSLCRNMFRRISNNDNANTCVKLSLPVQCAGFEYLAKEVAVVRTEFVVVFRFAK